MRMSLLREFSALANNRSYTKTAKELFMAPSTLSNHMSQLQEELGFRLIDNSKGSFALTSEGLEFLSAVWRILKEYDDAVAKGRSSYSDMETLYIQASKGFRFESFFEEALLSSGLKGKLRIETVDADEGVPWELIPDGKVDLAFIDLPNSSEVNCETVLADKPYLQAIPLSREKLLFAVESSGKLGKTKTHHPRDLNGHRIIIALGNKSMLGFNGIAASLKEYGAVVSPAFFQPAKQNKSRYLESLSEMDFGEDAIVLYSWMAEPLEATGKVVFDLGEEAIIMTHYGVCDPSKLSEDKLRFIRALEKLADAQENNPN